MAEKGDDRQHTNPSLRETLASTGEAHRQKEPDPLSWNQSMRMSFSGSSSRSSASHGGDLRQLLNRGINWIEESLSPPHCILDSFYYESSSKFHLRYFQRNDENRHDGWRPYSPVMARSRSRSLLHSSLATHNAKEDSHSKDTDYHYLPNRGSNSWSGECSAVRSSDMCLSTEDKRKRNGQDSSRSPEHKWRKTGPHQDRSGCSERRGANTPRCGLASPNVDGSRSSTVSQWSKVAHDSTKNTNQKESDGWGQKYSPIKNSRSRSLTRSFQAAVDTNNNKKETDKWGMALGQTSPGGGLKLYPYYYSTLESTSCSGGTDTKMGASRDRGSDIESVVNPVEPTPVIPNLAQSQPNQNHVEEIGTAAVQTTYAVDNHSFQWALIGFVKPKLKPFLLKQLLNDANYLDILDKFVKNVTQSLGTCAPQTREDSCKFLVEENDCLSKFLQMYLRRFVAEDVIMNMRYDGRNEG